jgi:SulP family sulfate permease
MDADDIALLESVMESRSFEAGQELFAHSSHGDELFVVRAGEVEIRIPTTLHHHKRLATYGPGTVFGEVSFFDPGPRSAAAVASTDCEVLVLDQAGLEKLRQAHPEAALALLTELARAQGNSLRWTTAELHRISQW